MKTSTLLTLLAAAKQSFAYYAVQDDYSADKWWDMFDMFTEADPTDGFGTLRAVHSPSRKLTQSSQVC
jgi:hypothetical protein